MEDQFSKETRSYIMSQIRSQNTSPEILVRKFLFFKGFRYRLYAKGLPGKPDIVLKKYKTVIFVNGCFWHGHADCTYFSMPKTRTEWWTAKICATQERDIKNKKELEELGWKVLVVWECQLKDNKENRLQELVKELKENA